MFRYLVVVASLFASSSVAQVSNLPSIGVGASQDCAALASIERARSGSTRQSLFSCNSSQTFEHYLPSKDPNFFGRNVCPSVYVGPRDCLALGKELCYLQAEIDRKVAHCRASETFREQFEAANKVEGFDLVDNTTDVAKAANRLLGRDSPASRLSKKLTKYAVDNLNSESKAALGLFQEELRRWEATGSKGSFRDHWISSKTFIPGASDNKTPPANLVFPEGIEKLLELATAVSQMEYDLPLGDRFSSDPGGAELLAAAVDAALKGDLSGFSGGQEISDLVSEMLESATDGNRTFQSGSQNGDFNLAAALSAMQGAKSVESRDQESSPGANQKNQNDSLSASSGFQKVGTCAATDSGGIQHKCSPDDYVWIIYKDGQRLQSNFLSPLGSQRSLVVSYNDIVAECRVSQKLARVFLKELDGYYGPYPWQSHINTSSDRCLVAAKCVREEGSGKGVCW